MINESNENSKMKAPPRFQSSETVAMRTREIKPTPITTTSTLALVFASLPYLLYTYTDLNRPKP
jgi:hypothetical protein